MTHGNARFLRQDGGHFHSAGMKVLPIPGIDFFEDFPLLTLAVANLEPVNSL